MPSVLRTSVLALVMCVPDYPKPPAFQRDAGHTQNGPGRFIPGPLRFFITRGLAAASFSRPLEEQLGRNLDLAWPIERSAGGVDDAERSSRRRGRRVRGDAGVHVRPAGAGSCSGRRIGEGRSGHAQAVAVVGEVENASTRNCSRYFSVMGNSLEIRASML